MIEFVVGLFLGIFFGVIICLSMAGNSIDVGDAVMRPCLESGYTKIHCRDIILEALSQEDNKQ